VPHLEYAPQLCGAQGIAALLQRVQQRPPLDCAPSAAAAGSSRSQRGERGVDLLLRHALPDRPVVDQQSQEGPKIDRLGRARRWVSGWGPGCGP
jgi:hypothetical protein